MRTAVLALAVFLLAFLLVAVMCGAREGDALEVRSLELVVERPDGPPVLLQFKVAAANAGAATAAAERAAMELVPGGLVRFEPEVTAAWRPWSWSWDQDELPVVIAYNPEGAAPGVSPDAIIGGLQAWSSVGTSSFRFEYGGITNNVASILEDGPDGENVVSWKSLPCELGCVLGVASKEETHEVDLVLNSNPEAATQAGISGGKLDWRTVILHELGHVAGLEHSCPAPFGICTDAELAAVMFYQYTGIQRQLEPDDAAGISALYPALEETPTPGPFPTPTPFPETTVDVEPGWNLVLLPSGDPARIGAEMSCVTAIYGWDGEGWRAWVRGLIPGMNDLQSLVSGRGYWVLADGRCRGEFAGF